MYTIYLFIFSGVDTVKSSASESTEVRCHFHNTEKQTSRNKLAYVTTYNIHLDKCNFIHCALLQGALSYSTVCANSSS